jgi:spectinomycin phosphotransferase/16S rRNA (guanine(1405)-N(7))-methyltransferase
VFTRPTALTDDQVVTAVSDGWGVELDSVAYEPVGFGSHHWRGTADGHRWFVTVDDLDAKRWTPDESRRDGFERLDAALRTARELRDAGLGFVVAPERDEAGHVLRDLDRFALSLYAHVEGRSHEYGAYASSEDRLAVLGLVVRLHRAPRPVAVCIDDLELRNRRDLDQALTELDRTWDSGPYAEGCRSALETAEPVLRRRLADHDALAAAARQHPERMVVTHGEPHAANTMLTADGWVLVDWDTVLVAPPERDLWAMAGEDPSVLDAYRQAGGQEPDRDVIELYRLGWDLAEVAIYTALLRAPHERSVDVDTSWGHLQGYLEQLTRE